MFLFLRVYRFLNKNVAKFVRRAFMFNKLTLTNAYTEQVQQSIKESFQNLKVICVQIYKVPQCLYHRRRQPDAHIFLRTKP